MRIRTILTSTFGILLCRAYLGNALRVFDLMVSESQIRLGMPHKKVRGLDGSVVQHLFREQERSEGAVGTVICPLR